MIDQMLGDNQLLVPSRDVLHIKLHANSRYPFPLIGESPLTAAMSDVAVSSAFTEQQLQFLANQARPSAVLSTDLILDKDQVAALRERWNEQSKGMAQGNTPILTGGLRVQPWATPAKDAQLAELMRMSAERICLAFRVPLQLVGLAAAPFSSTEALMQFWLSTGLGFALELVEQSFDRLFNLTGEPAEFTEFDTSALLRTAEKDRIDALVRGVMGGLYSPNEARAMEGLDAVEYGSEPRTQAQNVPLSAASAIPSSPAAPAAPASASALETKSFDAAVQRDIDPLARRAVKPVCVAEVDGKGRVIRKVTESAIPNRLWEQISKHANGS